MTGALDSMAKGQRNGRLKKKVEEESVMVGLSREDALCRSKWIGVNLIANRLE